MLHPFDALPALSRSQYRYFCVIYFVQLAQYVVRVLVCMMRGPLHPATSTIDKVDDQNCSQDNGQSPFYYPGMKSVAHSKLEARIAWATLYS